VKSPGDQVALKKGPAINHGRIYRGRPGQGAL